MLSFARILQDHWSEFLRCSAKQVGPHHWRAVDAVLGCRSPRRGGHLAWCPKCQRVHYLYHSCNHRNCPQCGSSDQAQWSASQQKRLLPVPYYLLTFTLPAQLRGLFHQKPDVLYNILFGAVSQSLQTICQNPKHLGGDPGFIAVLHTWTRRMLFHPHIHVLFPGVALAPGGCDLVYPKEVEYLLPVQALSAGYKNHFKELLAEHPDLYAQLDASIWKLNWGVNIQEAGRGKAALRYLAGYVKQAAFSEKRLIGYDEQGHLLLRWKDSEHGQFKIEKLSVFELIDRWLLHILPKGFKTIRYYGWLTPAAHKTFRRIGFMLGLGPLEKSSPAPNPCLCPRCQHPLKILTRITPLRGPPLYRKLFA